MKCLLHAKYMSRNFWQDKFLQVCLRPQEFQINLKLKNTTCKVLSNMVKADDTYVCSLDGTTSSSVDKL